MGHKKHLLIVIAILLVSWSRSGQAQDWNQWRGPERNGCCSQAVKLIDALDGKPLPALWKSEQILGGKDGGYGSPVVADGKVYQYCSWCTYQKLEFMRVGAGEVANIGLIPDKADDALLAKVEAARPAMLDLAAGPTRQKAAKDWIAANLSDDEKKLLAGYAERRLTQGKDALPIAVLRKVKTIINRQFATLADVEAWYKENGIDDAAGKQINNIFPRPTSSRQDMVFCLDAGNGKTLWKKSWPSEGGGLGGPSGTPLVVDKRVYFLGGDATAHCLDAQTGDEIWKTPISVPAKNDALSSSFAYLDGTVFILCNHLLALRADTGAILWEQSKGPDNEKATGSNSSPVLWTCQGKTYVISGAEQIACVSPQDGKTLWTVKGGRYSTPVIVGDSMAVAESNKGITFYRISPDGATKITETQKTGSSRGASVAADGKCFYTTGNSDAAAFDVKTFAQVWKSPGLKEDFASPLVCDGKLIGYTNKGAVGMFNADTGASLGKVDCAALTCTSPVLSDGHLFIRTTDAVVCYDLRKKAE